MLEGLAKAAEMIRAAEGKPGLKHFNCHAVTAAWLRETFPPDVCGVPWPSRFPMWFGTPIYEVDHLMPGFMEAELSDGTRQIIKIRGEVKVTTTPSGQEG